MKLQRLTDSMKSDLDEQSTLKSELSKKATLVEMLRKENEVNIVIRVLYFYSNVHMLLCNYNMESIHLSI